jgi:hypothetical protein
MKAPFDEDLLPSRAAVWAWQEKLNSFGPRLTGGAAHRQSVDFLQAELAAVGLQVLRDRRRFRRWEARRWSLRLESPAGVPEDLPVTSCYPYSGRTAPQGVRGELVHYARPPRSFAAAAGKITVVEVAVPRIPRLLLPLVLRKRARVPDRGADFACILTSPLLSLACAPDLAAARHAGVLGVVCVWRKCSEENAAGQYLPFTTPYGDCPALWVGASVGDRLKQRASAGGEATLVLEASLDEDAETDTIYAVLPGTDPSETIIVNTHSDGPNACEENGGVAILALAHYFAGLPPQARRRSIVFALVTGHFQIPQLGGGGQAATRAWLEAHPELWDGKNRHKRAVAGVTIEHLGCTEWKDDKTFTRCRPTGRLELELVFAGNAAMARIYRDALDGRTLTRTMILKPIHDIYVGEGQPLFQAGIPTVSLIPLPDYLCSAQANMDKLDPHLMWEQIRTFAKAVREIDRTPTAVLGKPDPQYSGLLGAALKLLGKTNPLSRQGGVRSPLPQWSKRDSV